MARLPICFLVFFLCIARQVCFACESQKEPDSYSKLKANAELAILKFANSKVIATEADATLSKLISAKSPIITSWIRKRRLSDKPEVEIVKAWREYYAKNFVLSKYPHELEQKNKALESLVDGLISEYSQPDFKKKLERLFQKSKKASITVIQNFQMKDSERAALVKRISAINLYWPKSLKLARNNSSPLDIVNWGIAYDPVPNEINIGLNSWAYPDEATYLSVFSHEIGHAFDSCRWSAFFAGQWPFHKIGKCLRSNRSVAAKFRDDSQLSRLTKEKKISSSLAFSLKQNLTCNKVKYPPLGIQKDQLPESFADWFSAEVIAHLVEDIDVSSVRSDLCAEKTLSQGSSYPPNTLRLNAIYKVHPKINPITKANAKYQYCAMQ